MNLKLFTDGGSRGNPGPAATGGIILNEKNEIIKKFHTYLGKQTNNFAEYSALFEGLTLAIKLKPKKLDCFLDSKLVVEQSLGHWKVKEESLRPFVSQIQKILISHPEFSLIHVPREKNKQADALVNQCLNQN